MLNIMTNTVLSVGDVLLVTGILFLISMIFLFRYDRKIFFEILTYIIIILICIIIFILILFSKADSIFEFFIGFA